MSFGYPKKGGVSLFHLFGVASGTFYPFSACYSLLRVIRLLQATTSQNVLICKFTINQLLQRSASVIIKRIKRDRFLNCKAGQAVLPSREGAFKWDNFYYKVGQ